MSAYRIRGGRPLRGTVPISGAKNSVLPILAATLLNGGRSVLHNCPHLRDVESAIRILRHLGCTVSWEGDTITVDSSRVSRWDVPHDLMREMRSSVIFLGPILARCGRARLSLPGGCEIGQRPIDLHLAALRRLGVTIRESGGDILCQAGDLRGRDVILGFPSVGATETLLLAAACARGRTVLRGAAREPEVADLADFLNRCGGSVEGAGSSTLIIEGRRALGGCVFSPLPDRIFASTLACAAAAAGGRVELTGCSPELYAPVLEILAQMGCRVERGGESVQVARFGRLYGAGRVFTGVYPALATDAAPPLAAAMLCAEGESSIEDVIFERRFACAEGFAALGGRVNTAGRVLHIRPGGTLRGTRLSAPDLRGGAALVLAALAAQGRSQIGGVAYLDRGYADFTEILASLGARIYRETKPA